MKIHLPVVAFTLVAAVFMARPASAEDTDTQCGARAAQILQALYPQARKVSESDFTIDGASVTIPTPQDIGTSPYTMVCRLWPARPQYLLVALPMLIRQDDDGAAGDIDVVVLDNASLKPVARYRDVGEIDDNAFALRALDFDTAPYRLFEGRVAFGLRATRSGSSRVNPLGETGLWLFDLNGASLQPVLVGLRVMEYGGENDGDCKGEFEEMQRTLAIGTERHQGAADILLTTRTKDSKTAHTPDGQCHETETGSEITRSRLHYDGQRYVIPEEMQVTR